MWMWRLEDLRGRLTKVVDDRRRSSFLSVIRDAFEVHSAAVRQGVETVVGARVALFVPERQVDPGV